MSIDSVRVISPEGTSIPAVAPVKSHLGSKAKILKILIGALAALTATFLHVSQQGLVSKVTLFNLLMQIWLLTSLINRIMFICPKEQFILLPTSTYRIKG